MNTFVRFFFVRVASTSLRSNACCWNVLVWFVLAVSFGRAGDFFEFNPSGDEIPYREGTSGPRIVDMEPSLRNPVFDACRWGTPMDVGVNVGSPPLYGSLQVSFGFTKLTEQPEGTTLFLRDPSNNAIADLSTRADAVLSRSSPFSAGSVALMVQTQQTLQLLRKHHFPSTLYLSSLSDVEASDTRFTSRQVSPSTRKVIVLIHGWNRTGDGDAYDAIDGDEFYTLARRLAAACANTGWDLLVYHWELDADTGNGAGLFADPVKAAHIARLHGYHLAERLDRLSNQQLERVHFIAHSAGSWAARSAARYLLRERHPNNRSLGGKPIQVQVTLMDPFIPSVTGVDNMLTTAVMSGINEFEGAAADTLFRLENYYSDDFASNNILTVGTQEVFEWRGIERDWNRRVDMGLQGTYLGHSGPIQFLADSVIGTQQYYTLPVYGPPHTASGFLASMFMSEPVFDGAASASVLAGQQVTLTQQVNTRRGKLLNSQPLGITGLQWQKRDANNQWQNVVAQIGRFEGTTSVSLVIKSTQVADAGAYRLQATYDGLVDASAAVTLTISGGTTPTPGTAPAAPSNLVATPYSASQINLTWNDNANNETGFKLQRRLASGTTWTDLSPVGQNVQASANTSGLSAGTSYVYRVRATNASGDSAWSNESSATTLAPQGTNYTLQVDAVDLAASQVLAASVGSWTGLGDNFQTKTTGFMRTFSSGTQVTVSAPATLVGGRIFQYWLLDSVTRTYNTSASVEMSSGHVFIAIYGATPPPARTPASLAIEGLSAVDENGSASYKARATFSDGTSAYVTPVWDDDSSYAVISSSGVLDAEAVSSDKTVTITASYTAGGVTKTATKNVTIRNAVSTQTYTLTRNVIGNGEIGYSPHATSYAAGTIVSLHANDGDGYVFSHWTGDVSPTDTDDDITVRMDRNRSVTAHFVPDTTEGHLQVNLSPAQAVAEGAGWKYYNYTNFRPSGDTQNGLTPATGKYVYFKDIPGWITPDQVKVDVIGGQTTVLSGVAATYREILGVVQVTLSPPEVVAAGARWRLAGETAWRESGQTINDVNTGAQTVEFSSVAGWTAPPARPITVTRGNAVVVTESYGPPPGLPVITSITPNTGTIEGGIEITIDCANIAPGATVKFGGVSATGVNVISASRLSAILPPTSNYGTVSVSVTSNGQTAVKAAGFTYNIPLGMNMVSLSQIGGSVQAVAAQGAMTFYGEGSSIVAADFTNTTAPVIRGRLQLPGMVRDIKISGHLALIADNQWGVQVVDITNPAAMRVLSFYDTPGTALQLEVNANTAYLADSSGGVQIFDFSIPTAIARIATYSTPDPALDIELTTVAGKLIACVAINNQGISLLDVTNVASISEVSRIESGVWNTNVAVEGAILIARGSPGGNSDGEVFDISNPSLPVRVGQGMNEVSIGNPLLLKNGVLFIGSGDLAIYDANQLPSPQRVTYLSLDSRSYGMAASGNTLFMANGNAGLVAIDVTNPSSPSVRSRITSNFIPVDVQVSGGVAHLAIDGGYSYSIYQFPVLTSINVSVPEAPQRLGTANSNYGLDFVELFGSNIFTATGDSRGAPVFSIQNPQQPSQVAVPCQDRYAYCLARLNGNAIIGGQTKSAGGDRPLLTVLNGTTPANTAPISTFELSTVAGFVEAIAVTGNRVFAFVADVGMKVVDYSNLSAPQIVGTYSFAGFPREAVASDDGRYVYVADQSNGLRIFDCLVPSNPLLLTTYARNGFTNGLSVAVQGGLVFYGDGRGVNVLNCENPASPILVAAYDTPGVPDGIAVINDIVYVADQVGGFLILRLGDVNKPVVEIVQPTRNSRFENSEAFVSLEGVASDAQGITRVSWQNARGGGGEASGTTNWTITGLPLFTGENIVTVTAEDGNGNVATDTITIVSTPPDTTPPVVTITGPKPEAEFATDAETVTLSGLSADNTGVVEVAWADTVGHSGVAVRDGQTWNIVALPLDFGTNTITVTARDAAGLTGVDAVTIFRLPPDVTPPVVTINFPTNAQEIGVNTTSVNLAGGAEDDRSLEAVRWSTNNGESGGASGKGRWVANGIPLQPGLNIVTITARDTAGNEGVDTLAVTAALVPSARDPNRPALVITSPRAGARFGEDTVTVSGTAHAGRGVAEVRWQVGEAPWQVAGGTQTWAFSLADVPPGPLTFRMKSVDAEGYESPVVERTVTRVVTAPLVLTVVGEGEIVGRRPLAGGVEDGDALELNRVHTLQAKPARGFVFAGWSGSIAANDPTLTFLMETGVALTATFVPTPFPAVHGSYSGLVETEPFLHELNGSTQIKSLPSGRFTAAFVLGGKKLALAGVFDAEGRYFGTLPRGRATPLNVSLQLDVANGSDRLIGTVSDGEHTAALNTDRDLYDGKTVSAPSAGRYTAVIEPTPEAITLPAGFGHGVLTVNASGDVRFVGRLGDGAPVMFGGRFSKRSQWPIYVSLYKATGALIGWANFRDIPDTSDLDARLHWFRPAKERALSFADGFDGDVLLSGSAYTPPDAGEIVLDLPLGAGNAKLVFTSGPLAQDEERTITIDAGQRVSAAFAEPFQMKLNVGTGALSGQITLAAPLGKMSFDGVLLPKIGMGKGQVRFGGDVGAVKLLPTVP